MTSSVPESYEVLSKIQTFRLVIAATELIILKTCLSPSTRRGARVSGCAKCFLLANIIREAEGGAAVLSKHLQCLPGAAKVLRALQAHGSGTRRAKNHHHMRQTELVLQVQADLILCGRCGPRLPPCVRVEKRIVSHQ